MPPIRRSGNPQSGPCGTRVAHFATDDLQAAYRRPSQSPATGRKSGRNRETYGQRDDGNGNSHGLDAIAIEGEGRAGARARRSRLRRRAPRTPRCEAPRRASLPRRPPERPKARRRHTAPTAGAAREQGGRRRRRRRLLRPRSGCRLRARLVWQLERSAPLEQQMWRRPSPSTMSRARPGTRRHRARARRAMRPQRRAQSPSDDRRASRRRHERRTRAGFEPSEQRQHRPNGLAQVGRCPKRRRRARARAEVATGRPGASGRRRSQVVAASSRSTRSSDARCYD